MKFKRIFKFTTLGLPQGEAEGRISSSFANVPASLCQPFTITMSQLSRLSARRVFNVFQHIMFLRSFQRYMLVLGNCGGWNWCTSPWWLPGGGWRKGLEDRSGAGHYFTSDDLSQGAPCSKDTTSCYLRSSPAPATVWVCGGQRVWNTPLKGSVLWGHSASSHKMQIHWRR